jgi:hypothetical protein
MLKNCCDVLSYLEELELLGVPISLVTLHLDAEFDFSGFTSENNRIFGCRFTQELN